MVWLRDSPASSCRSRGYSSSCLAFSCKFPQEKTPPRVQEKLVLTYKVSSLSRARGGLSWLWRCVTQISSRTEVIFPASRRCLIEALHFAPSWNCLQPKGSASPKATPTSTLEVAHIQRLVYIFHEKQNPDPLPHIGTVLKGHLSPRVPHTFGWVLCASCLASQHLPLPSPTFPYSFPHCELPINLLNIEQMCFL